MTKFNLPVGTATIEGTQQRTVNGRDLHAALKIGRDYSNWVKTQIEKAGFIEGKEYVKISNNINIAQTGEVDLKGNFAKVKIEYFFTLSAAKEIAMMSKSPVGKEVRLYFIKCEETLNKIRAYPVSSQNIEVFVKQVTTYTIRQKEASESARKLSHWKHERKRLSKAVEQAREVVEPDMFKQIA